MKKDSDVDMSPQQYFFFSYNMEEGGKKYIVMLYLKFLYYDLSELVARYLQGLENLHAYLFCSVTVNIKNMIKNNTSNKW